MARTDCGRPGSGPVTKDVEWPKLAAMAEGARIASQRLFLELKNDRKTDCLTTKPRRARYGVRLGRETAQSVKYRSPGRDPLRQVKPSPPCFYFTACVSISRCLWDEVYETFAATCDSFNYLGFTSVQVNANVPAAVPPPSRGSPWSGKPVSLMVPATCVPSELNVKV